MLIAVNEDAWAARATNVWELHYEPKGGHSYEQENHRQRLQLKVSPTLQSMQAMQFSACHFHEIELERVMMVFEQQNGFSKTIFSPAEGNKEKRGGEIHQSFPSFQLAQNGCPETAKTCA